MKKTILFSLSAVLLFSSCAREFNQVYKTDNLLYKYEYAKESFANGKYERSISLLQDLVTPLKGTENAQECLYMLAMAEYCSRDYEGASETFKKYYSSYPKGTYAEEAEFYVGQSLYMSTPEPRLDQSQTVAAISAFQEFLDMYPDSKLRNTAQNRLFALQDKLVKKELLSAQLYYNLGSYFGNCTDGGNNYEACIITSQNALKDYPYSNLRENFAILIMKSKFELAQQSVEEKKLERYQDAEDECYGFINEYPDSKEKATAQRYIAKCKEYTKENATSGAVSSLH
ncbi:MAG: outer membrane protein assembly factor BamD [Prevotella sp.]|jgi:outer membrane protein assembly factor BamD|nr:outer membrane protein assembly factor BamD [Prevotella sp.]MCI2080435.1 outer membrane protein assembly factor BamD [Prevotella sp.]MCI2102259.1 outer membrane protein assembly factor BamD [Prevotella sp.]